MRRRDWSRQELIVAFNLYCKLPFGRIHTGTEEVMALARTLGRTPSAVSWKLANFARLDPVLQQRNIKGATHGSRAELEIWREFNNNWDKLAFESERLVAQMRGDAAIFEATPLPEGKTREAIVRTRINQNFFRLAVLASYGGRCCVTGLAITPLLNASHIVPWSVDEKNRTNPANGLCLNAIHDRAFDCGLLTVTTGFKVKISPTIRQRIRNNATQDFLWKFDGESIALPQRFVPDISFLRYHNKNVFINA